MAKPENGVVPIQKGPSRTTIPRKLEKVLRNLWKKFRKKLDEYFDKIFKNFEKFREVKVKEKFKTNKTNI